jgi:telomere length regulation protein
MLASDELHEDVIQQCANVLEQDVQEISVLLRALCTPLHALRLLPSKYKSYVDEQLHMPLKVTDRHISRIQSALLQRVLPTWEQELKDRSSLDIVECWLSPPLAESRSTALIVIEAYASLVVIPLNKAITNRLARLFELHPIEVLHRHVFTHSDQRGQSPQLRWDESIRTVFSIPAKVANAAAAQKFDVPAILEHGPFFTRIAASVECLINDHYQDQSQSKECR